MHRHTPPKSFHPSMDKTHTNGQKKNLGAYVKKETGTQNIKEEEKKEGIHTIRTTGKTNRGGGT